MINRIANIGGGPAGTTLAWYLRKFGKSVAIFADQARPELIVGESLVPAVVSFLQEMGIEEEVRSYSTFKPGATFFMRPDDETTFNFSVGLRGVRSCPHYAYNVPRSEFDQSLFDAALKTGTLFFKGRTELLHSCNDRVSLTPADEERFRAALGGSPDLIVDASGRRRQIAKLLDIPSSEGSRKDIALFAHLNRTLLAHTGHIHINRLSKGWSWRIPLPGRVSVGIVAPADFLESIAPNSSEQYDQLIKIEPQLSSFCSGAERVSKVMKYNNYQLCSTRMWGANWAMTGDAAGFIDPIFSSGLLLSFSGAKSLAKTISQNTPNLAAYERSARKRLLAWQRIVDYFYNGRLFSLVRMGRLYGDRFPTNLLAQRMERHVTRVLGGVGADSTYNQQMLKLIMAYALKGRESERLQVR